jgi:hypothetical protein
MRSRWSTRRGYRLRAWFSLALRRLGRGRRVDGRRGLLLAILFSSVGRRAFVRGNFSRRFGGCGRRRGLRLGPRLWLGDDLLCGLIA